MGVDFAIANAAAVMLDQRSQPIIHSNKWFPNEVTDQLYSMNVLNNFDGRESPLGLAPADFAAFANYTQSRPSSFHSITADASDDPNGMTMDNGNELCQSPGMDSIYSTNLGTPNSFIADSYLESPRERGMSTSSSTYTYSPYNGHEDELTCNTIAPPHLRRQSSSEMVEQYFLNESSPGIATCTEESGLTNDSQGFFTHFNASTEAAQQNYLSSSQPQEFFKVYLNDLNEIPTLQTNGSPTADSTQQPISTSESDTDATSHGNTSPTNAPATSEQNFSTSITFVVQNPPISRQTSILSEIISETIPTNSQDAPMIQECYEHFANSQNFTTLNVGDLQVPSTQNAVESNPSSNTNSLCDKTNNINCSTPSSRVEDDVTAARRERNNAACRASRKRRKEKKNEMESSISRFENENEMLRREIEQLEVECKKLKTNILACMSMPTS